MVKPAYGQPIDKTTYLDVVEVFEKVLKIVHPFTFIAEEIWQLLKEKTRLNLL